MYVCIDFKTIHGKEGYENKECSSRIVQRWT